jgi:SAM-dependent methyltransferase
VDGASHLKTVDYDSLAATYERRYEHYRYDGIERELLRFLGRSLSALEVGCGTGHWLELLDARGHASIGLDASREMLGQASGRLPNVSLVHGTAESLPWRSNSFDRVFCINAFHHFRQKQQFLSEARRVLHAGGGLMVVGLDPHTGRDQRWEYEYFGSAAGTDKARFPSARTIRDWMSGFGFRDIETTEAQHFDLHQPALEALEQGRLDKNQSSQLALLSDEEYERGIARMRREIEEAASRGDAFMIVSRLRLYATVGWLPHVGPGAH